MPAPGFLQQVFARAPKSLARLPEVPVDRALEELRGWQTSRAGATPPPAAASPAPSSDALGATLCHLATHVWRAKNKMVDPKTGQPLDEMKRAYRHVEGAIDTLVQMEVTMNDWLNQSYDVGLPVKVLAFQPTPGVTRDTVIEAVRPAVVWKNQLLQLGEVIVGTPPGSAPTPPVSQ